MIVLYDYLADKDGLVLRAIYVGDRTTDWVHVSPSSCKWIVPGTVQPDE
jgi:hypothetical protein